MPQPLDRRGRSSAKCSVNLRVLLRGALFVAPWLAVNCGDSSDLVIGHVQSPHPVLPDAMPAGSDAGGTGGGGGSSPGGAGGAGDAGAGGDVAGAGGEGNAPTCQTGELPPDASLIHRYDFGGTGTVAVDLVGDADADLMGGATLDGSGVLDLGGVDDRYVNLPNGMVSALGDASFVIWTTYRGGAGYQRIFDFGTNDGGEDQRIGRGQNYLALIPFTNDIVVEVDGADPGIDQLTTTIDLTQDVEHQLAVVFHSGESVEAFLDGQSLGVTPTTALLSELEDVNNWLGRSNYDLDPPHYNGSYDEFRIYGVALSSCAVQTLYEAGPDVLP